MRCLIVALLLCAACAAAAPAGPPAQPERPPAPHPARLRVVEASVFKDGHVLVRQEATVVPRGGEVVLDNLPVPVFGSYHPYSATRRPAWPESSRARPPSPPAARRSACASCWPPIRKPACG